MLHYDPRHCLPSAAELPDSDDTPVDNELQNLIPNLLEAILAIAWADRQDWFMGIDMGIYYAPEVPPLVPDGFLSLGVERFVGEEGRLSYVLWEEDNIVPILTLEVASKTYGGEYERKKKDYAELGVLYYVIYVPDRRHRCRRQLLEVHRLVDGEYVLQKGDRIWMPEIGLALGRERGTYLGRTREWLYWYDQQGNRLLTPEELVEQERQRAEQERQRAEQAEQTLRELRAQLQRKGIDLEA
ncbi:Uma2 family endonuclease [Leptothermofonsia sichuanensis E412]|uniref:Uma2 family endonuclease n=1 Tax=Leptothermofonsia sichuanensis TaxID=2917832 RepID=UPI001CA69199|nr:Uma2 family endonuclease [Leptothermofonsia sichuanensis]QZZ20169.1 Uma2 family endonuclease [Leptothermofonsia sichuanensis E412]